MAQSSRKPIRIWLKVAGKDLHRQDPPGTFSQLAVGQQLHGARVEVEGLWRPHVFAGDAAHGDGSVVAQTVPAPSEWLWRDYPR
jgi:hypothetical protein